MKKWIVLGLTLVAILVAMAAFALPVSASAGVYGDLLLYVIENEEVTILDTNDSSIGGVLFIPDEIDGYPVTAINAYAFGRHESLMSIVIPDSVTTIGELAFWSCSSLTRVEIGDSVTTIGAGAFEGCNSLASIEIPNSVTAIGDSAFRDCSSLTKITFLSPSTDIDDSSYTISSTATIYGYENSTAEAYANQYSRNFVSLGVYHTCSFNQKKYLIHLSKIRSNLHLSRGILL